MMLLLGIKDTTDLKNNHCEIRHNWKLEGIVGLIHITSLRWFTVEVLNQRKIAIVKIKVSLKISKY